MTTTSYPVRDAPITHAMWRETFAGRDGITDDFTGDAFHLTLPNTGDVGTVESGGKYRFRGFTLSVDVDHTVSLPAATSGTKTYDVGVKYDPANEAAVGGPLTIFAAEAGTYSPSGGTAYVVLHRVVRTVGQVLSAAAVDDRRSWTGATYYGSPGAYAGSYPVGSRLILVSGVELLRVPTFDDAGVVTGTQWRSPNSPAWKTLALASGMTAWVTTPQYAKVGNELHLRGTVQRTNGQQLAAANVTVTLATLPVAVRPGVLTIWPAAGSHAGEAGAARLSVETDGRLTYVPANDGATFVSLDGLRVYLPVSGPTFTS